MSDPTAELAARQAAVTALRQAGADREALVRLSAMLYNLAAFHGRQGQHSAAVPLLEEVVALDERTGHPDLESDRAALEDARRAAAGTPEPTLREHITEWSAGPRDEESLAGLINLVCNLTIAAICEGDTQVRWALAHDLAWLRAARPLPIAGASDFLHVLQLWLRGEPGMTERAASIAAGLPGLFQNALGAMERMIAGEDAAVRPILRRWPNHSGRCSHR